MKKTPMPNPAEGLFENIPKINEQFQRLDCSIRHFRKSKFFPEVTKARLIQERDVLIEAFKKMQRKRRRLSQNHSCDTSQ